MESSYAELESLNVKRTLWDRFFTVAPLVLVGTVDADGRADLAPKHMAIPLGWDNYFGFVCTPRHATYRNVKQAKTFTVTYPRPAGVVAASLAASPRCDLEKPVVAALETFPARHVNGVFLKNGYLFFECELDRIVDGFGQNALIAGTIVAAYVHRDALRTTDRDDADVLLAEPQLAYLYPGRFAVIDRTKAFPFPAGMQR